MSTEGRGSRSASADRDGPKARRVPRRAARRGSRPVCAGLDGDQARRVPRAFVAFALGAGIALAAAAQALSLPVPGQGPGFHDPRSAFKPIEERDGVVPWRLLAMVTTRVVNNRVVPTFPDPVKALDGQPVRLQGFMLPLEPGERQRHFLLSAVPTTCAFCVPAGPEGLVEVRAATPVRYSVDAVTLEGRMAVLTNDRYGLFYHLSDAAEVR